MRIPTFGRIPSSYVKAKVKLRDHYLALIKSKCDTVQAYRSDRKYTSAPAINIVGVGIGEKFTADKWTGAMCVKVFVGKKFAKSRVKTSDLIPESIGGIPTDVIGVGYAKRRTPKRRTRVRPVQPGVSISPDYPYELAGTFGVVVSDRRNKHLYILSNNHVLADEGFVSVGTPILQPGTLDWGDRSDRVAKLSEVVPLKFDNARNWMDAAIARLYASCKVEKAILGIGAPRSGGTPQLNTPVQKSGRTTGITKGIIRELKVDKTDIEFENGWVRMDDVFAIEGISGPFDKAGDSGSAIVDAQGRVVGLLFAGDDQRTYAIPIQRILRRFKVRIAR